MKRNQIFFSSIINIPKQSMENWEVVVGGGGGVGVGWVRRALIPPPGTPFRQNPRSCYFERKKKTFCGSLRLTMSHQVIVWHLGDCMSGWAKCKELWMSDEDTSKAAQHPTLHHLALPLVSQSATPGLEISSVVQLMDDEGHT